MPPAGFRRVEFLAATESPAAAVAGDEDGYVLIVHEALLAAGLAWAESLRRSLWSPAVLGISPKVVAADGRVDHCGLALAPNGHWLMPLRGLAADDPAYGAYGAVGRDVGWLSPVAALLSGRRLRELGGFLPGLGVAGALGELGLRARARGLRLVADGGIRAGGVGQVGALDGYLVPDDAAQQEMVRRWPGLFCGGDPYYHRSLREEPPDFGVR